MIGHAKYNQPFYCRISLNWFQQFMVGLQYKCTERKPSVILAHRCVFDVSIINHFSRYCSLQFLEASALETTFEAVHCDRRIIFPLKAFKPIYIIL